jgi:hypothetical protein
MWHEVEDLVKERTRVLTRPEPTAEVPYLDALEVTTDVEPEAYAGHLREVLDAALRIAATGADGESSVPVSELPDWFVRVSTSDGATAPEFARNGRQRFEAHPGTGGAWEAGDWLSRFELEDSIRGWAWWDLTRPADGKPRIWINAEGESHYSHVDLLWVAYVSGAAQVAYPKGLRPDEWATEPSLLG